MQRLLLLILVLIVNQNYAQNYELGKVTVEELSEKVCPLDTSAVAAYIFKDRITSYQYGKLINITRVKLKIYKKAGYDYANITQTYLKSKGLTFSDVATYNLVDGKVTKTNLSKESEFIQNSSEGFLEKKIILPNVKEGSIIEYKITSYENTLFRPVNFYFQEEIPIKSIILTIEYPEKLEYNKNLNGYLSPSFRSEILSDHIEVRKFKKRDTYQMLNVPAMIDEGYVNNIYNYRSRIQYEIASAENDIGDVEYIATDWKTITRNLYKFENFGGELSKKDYFEKELDERLLNKSTREDRINTILSFVKEKVKWNGFYGVTCDNGVKKAYLEKRGNVADINLMLTAMLKYAGYKASPILITTREMIINKAPSLRSHNYVICGVEIGDAVMTLDATNEYSLPNILPIRNLNFVGKILRENGTWGELDMTPQTNSEETITIFASITSQFEIIGKVRDRYADYNAFIYRDRIKLSSESYLELLEKKYPGITVTDFEVKNSADLTQPVIEEYSFETTKYLENIGDKLYFAPMVFFARTENPFKQEIREYPIDFIYPNQNKFNISINIPKGYVIETLPESKAFAMPDSLASFKYTISMYENKVQLQCVLEINKAVIGSEYYPALKNFFKEIVSKQTEKVVLKKV